MSYIFGCARMRRNDVHPPVLIDALTENTEGGGRARHTSAKRTVTRRKKHAGIFVVRFSTETWAPAVSIIRANLQKKSPYNLHAGSGSFPGELFAYYRIKIC